MVRGRGRRLRFLDLSQLDKETAAAAAWNRRGGQWSIGEDSTVERSEVREAMDLLANSGEAQPQI